MSRSPLIAVVLATLLSGSLTPALGYSGGAGAPADPYQIAIPADWQQLMATSADWNKNFILTADLNLAGLTLSPVGNSTTHFTGAFDGQNQGLRQPTGLLDDGVQAGPVNRESRAGVKRAGAVGRGDPRRALRARHQGDRRLIQTRSSTTFDNTPL